MTRSSIIRLLQVLCLPQLSSVGQDLHAGRYLDQQSDTITAEELQKFLDQYQLTQKDAAEILRIGEKNFSRWLNGKQRVSASMSNYIRTLTAVPEAFETLRKKQWETFTAK